jgi:parvulin-like peptidyl-prolyl isomerase
MTRALPYSGRNARAWPTCPAAVLVAALALWVALPARAGEVLDRIVATVNHHIILQSDWEDEISFEVFSQGRSPDQITAQDRKIALDHLIDQELLREQMQGTGIPQVSQDELNKRIAEIRRQFPAAAADQQWHSLLRQYGLTEGELKARLSIQLDLMRLVEARLRPTVQIDEKSIESYYNQQLLPQLRQSGGKDVPLAEVTPKIKELLTEQRVTQLLVSWLQSLRAGSEIQTDPLSHNATGQPQ